MFGFVLGKKNTLMEVFFFFFCDQSINPEKEEAAGTILPLSACSEAPQEMRMMMEKQHIPTFIPSLFRARKGLSKERTGTALVSKKI